ncbi:MAG: HNH endonuclease domain-containing protein, partial [Spirochaetia bacterium]
MMNIRPEARIRILFERLGFDTESRYYSADRLRRTGISWVSIVFRYRGGGVSESVDKIEAIIVQDRKWATYKLPLLRALCDTAQKEPNTAFWDINGQVHVPIESVARRWIEYYWPIVESRHFIPQMRGEKSKGSRFIAFRKNLQQLTDEYRELGGIEEFVFQRDEGRLKDRSSVLLKQTTEKVKDAIRQPIFYTGGGASADKPFTYSSSYETVVLAAELWRELILLGHIIADTLILRWAELTADISKGEVPISQMVELLLQNIEPGRNVADARQVYRHASHLECVWTGKTLTQSFDVDHAIPFSLRHDNSLWNLFPADPKQNNAKRDKLPESDLVLHRKDAILSYWELLKAEIPGRFSSDYIRITGEERLPESSWHTHLFSVFMEVLETTAATRGTPRWNGA